MSLESLARIIDDPVLSQTGMGSEPMTAAETARAIYHHTI